MLVNNIKFMLCFPLFIRGPTKVIVFLLIGQRLMTWNQMLLTRYLKTSPSLWGLVTSAPKVWPASTGLPPLNTVRHGVDCDQTKIKVLRYLNHSMSHPFSHPFFVLSFICHVLCCISLQYDNKHNNFLTLRNFIFSNYVVHVCILVIQIIFLQRRKGVL